MNVNPALFALTELYEPAATGEVLTFAELLKDGNVGGSSGGSVTDALARAPLVRTVLPDPEMLFEFIVGESSNRNVELLPATIGKVLGTGPQAVPTVTWAAPMDGSTTSTTARAAPNARAPRHRITSGRRRLMGRRTSAPRHPGPCSGTPSRAPPGSPGRWRCRR